MWKTLYDYVCGTENDTQENKNIKQGFDFKQWIDKLSKTRLFFVIIGDMCRDGMYFQCNSNWIIVVAKTWYKKNTLPFSDEMQREIKKEFYH